MVYQELVTEIEKLPLAEQLSLDYTNYLLKKYA